MNFAKLFKSLDVMWKIATIVLVAGQYWLKTNYVSRSEYLQERQQDRESQNERMVKISDAVSELNVSLRLFSANKAIIEDHEARLRSLEHGHPLP